MKPKEGETVSEYIRRYLAENHKNVTEPLITHLIYKFNNIETKEDYDDFIKIAKCDFNSYKDLHKDARVVSFEFETTLDPGCITYMWNKAGNIETVPDYECTGVVAHKYRKKTYAPKLKRLMR